MPKYTITTQLPTLNEYIDAERSNRYAASTMKKKFTDVCAGYALQIKNKINKVGFYNMIINWHVTNNKIDSDNVFFAVKFILDGLVKSGTLNGDGRKYIKNINNTIVTEKKYYIEVELNEICKTKL